MNMVKNKPTILNAPGVYNLGGGGGGGDIPPEYTPVEYIVNNDKGVIRCAFDLNTNESIFNYLRFQYVTKENYSSNPESILLYLTYDNSTSVFERVEVGSSSSGTMSIRLYYVESADFNTNLNFSSQQNVNCTFCANGAREFSTDDETAVNGIFSLKPSYSLRVVHFFGFTNSNNQWIFSEDKCGHQRINALKIFGRKSGKLIYNFVPVRKGTMPGFFETITKTFFPPTKNSGDIAYGPDVV